MDVRSLGFRTDLMLRRLSGAVIDDRGDHLVIRTPRNPTFYWGNFCLFGRAPAAGDARRWLATFAAEFPDAEHVAIGVDGIDGGLGDDADLRAAGLTPEANVVLVADHVVGPDRPPGAHLRPLHSDDDWAQTVELRMAVDSLTDADHRAFAVARAAEMREVVDGGHGVYVGAFVDGRLQSALGLMTDGAGIARYQTVETHPDYRRRGLAGGLIALAAGLLRDRVERFVIVADPDYVAIDLYRKLGFGDVERQVQWQRAPDRTTDPAVSVQG